MGIISTELETKPQGYPLTHFPISLSYAILFVKGFILNNMLSKPVLGPPNNSLTKDH